MVYLSRMILECPQGPQMVALGTPPLCAPHLHSPIAGPTGGTRSLDLRPPPHWLSRSVYKKKVIQDLGLN